MIEFPRNFETRGIKIALVKSIFINKSINLQFSTLILYFVDWCPLWPKEIFRAYNPFIENYMYTNIVILFKGLNNSSPDEILMAS